MAYEDYGLLVDYKYCSGCHACEVACKNHLGVGVGKFGIKLLEKGPYQLEGKDNWDWDYMPVPTALCDMYADRIDAGKKPTCVHHCLAFCLGYGPIDELAKKMKDLGNRVMIFNRTNHAE